MRSDRLSLPTPSDGRESSEGAAGDAGEREREDVENAGNEEAPAADISSSNEETGCGDVEGERCRAG